MTGDLLASEQDTLRTALELTFDDPSSLGPLQLGKSAAAIANIPQKQTYEEDAARCKQSLAKKSLRSLNAMPPQNSLTLQNQSRSISSGYMLVEKARNVSASDEITFGENLIVKQQSSAASSSLNHSSMLRNIAFQNRQLAQIGNYRLIDNTLEEGNFDSLDLAESCVFEERTTLQRTVLGETGTGPMAGNIANCKTRKPKQGRRRPRKTQNDSIFSIKVSSAQIAQLEGDSAVTIAT